MPQVVISRRRPTRRVELVAMDLLTVSPRTPRGFDKVLVTADLFTGFTVAVPVADETAQVAAQGFLDGWVATFRPPELLLTDNRPAFRAQFMQRLSQLLGIQKVFTLAHNPNANGVEERYSRTLCGLFAGMGADHDLSVGWDLFLPLDVHAYNASRLMSLGGSTPFEAMFGRTPNDFAQPALEAEVEVEALDEFSAQLRGGIRMMHEIALHASDRAHDREARRSEEKVAKPDSIVKPGDSVMLWRGVSSLQGRKLETPWVGPYVLESLQDARATIRSPNETFFVHADRLKKVDEGVELREDDGADSLRRDSVMTEILSLQRRRVDSHGVEEFLVAWYGAKGRDWTWFWAENLAEVLVREFRESMRNDDSAIPTRSGRLFR